MKQALGGRKLRAWGPKARGWGWTLHRSSSCTGACSAHGHLQTSHMPSPHIPGNTPARPPVRTEPEGKKGTKASASQIALAITGVGEGTHWHAVVRAEPTRQC